MNLQARAQKQGAAPGDWQKAVSVKTREPSNSDPSPVSFWVWAILHLTICICKVRPLLLMGVWLLYGTGSFHQPLRKTHSIMASFLKTLKKIKCKLWSNGLKQEDPRVKEGRLRKGDGRVLTCWKYCTFKGRWRLLNQYRRMISLIHHTDQIVKIHYFWDLICPSKIYKIDWKCKHFAFAEKPKEPEVLLLRDVHRTEVNWRCVLLRAPMCKPGAVSALFSWGSLPGNW